MATNPKNIQLTIDQRRVEVPEGTTVLEAAERVGIEIPTLCYLKGYAPATSCLVCVVKVRGQNRLVPACGTRAVEGMEIESETDEVHQARRTALELLLSDHVGDCLAPCQSACPAHMDVPLMLRQITAENLREAVATVKRDIALPAVLGRICPKPCEKACRRAGADGAVAVCRLKQFVADADLASAEPFRPECEPDTGKRVAILGAGPTGLSAAYYLRQQGHAVTVFDDRAEPGGRLRDQTSEEELPREVLDAEIAQILRLGISLERNVRIGEHLAFENVCADHDAVLMACGKMTPQTVEQWGLRSTPEGIDVDKGTFETSRPGVFAAGSAIRGRAMVVRSVADGKEAAQMIQQYLAGQLQLSREKAYSVRTGRMDRNQVAKLVALTGSTLRQEPSIAGESYTPQQAAQQGARCLHCDCQGQTTCKLRHYAARYGANPNRYRGQRVVSNQGGPPSAVIYEPGKCIDCGLCVQIASEAQEPLGLTFVGRGFSVRVGVPFDRSLDEALSRVAAACVAACPTAALSFRLDLEQEAGG
jgi:ferredoxin